MEGDGGGVAGGRVVGNSEVDRTRLFPHLGCLVYGSLSSFSTCLLVNKTMHYARVCVYFYEICTNRMYCHMNDKK